MTDRDRDDEYLSVKQVVAMIPGWTAEALYTSRTRGDGPYGYRVGRRLVFRRSEIDRWLVSKAEPKAEQPA